MDILTGTAIAAAGAAAGLINAVVGSGTLVTFPTLLALGYPPVTANVSNNVGLVVGGISGSWGYRRELAGQRRLLRRLAPMSAAGSVAGALLLLALPADAFETIVPVLIVVAVALVLLQPRIGARLARRREHSGPSHARSTALIVAAGVLLTGVYGGYFGAAQGVLLMAVMGIGIQETLQRLNGVKNVLAGIANTVAGILFVVVADVDWLVVLLIAIGSVVGGQLGATIGRRLPAAVLRAVIVVVGVAALVAFLLR